MMKSDVFANVMQRKFLLVFISLKMKMLYNCGEKKMTIFFLTKL